MDSLRGLNLISKISGTIRLRSYTWVSPVTSASSKRLPNEISQTKHFRSLLFPIPPDSTALIFPFEFMIESEKDRPRRVVSVLLDIDIGYWLILSIHFIFSIEKTYWTCTLYRILGAIATEKSKVVRNSSKPAANQLTRKKKDISSRVSVGNRTNRGILYPDRGHIFVYFVLCCFISKEIGRVSKSLRQFDIVQVEKDER